MSLRTSILLQTVLCNVQAALATGVRVDAGILGDFTAGTADLAASGREPSDSELAALTTLGAAVAAFSETMLATAATGAANPTTSDLVTTNGLATADLTPDTSPSPAGTSAAVGGAGDAEASSSQVTETSAGEPAPSTPAEEDTVETDDGA